MEYVIADVRLGHACHVACLCVIDAVGTILGIDGFAIYAGKSFLINVVESEASLIQINMLMANKTVET